MANELTKEEVRELIQQPDLREQVKILDKIVADGLAVARGILDGTNPDSFIPFKHASTRTRFGMELTKQALHAQREQKADERQLGVLILRERMTADVWEKHAADVDKAENAKAFIDVEAKT